MASIQTPVTWIHGRFDAWMDFERVRLLMGAGSPAGRKLIEVPTGHQLRSSVEAIEVFQLVACEIGRLTGAGDIARAVPDPGRLKRRSQAERRRLPRPIYEPRKFWRDYLVGRNGHLGIELMTGTAAYEALMDEQVKGLDLQAGHRVMDLGSGTGSLVRHLSQRRVGLRIEVCELDFVADALRRPRARQEGWLSGGDVKVASMVCDLALPDDTSRIPLHDESQDAALASLLISYLPSPERLLREVWRIFRPGGRFVLSTLRPAADTSRIYEQGVEELKSGRARILFEANEQARLGESLQSFMNDAARLLELEEQSIFRFFDASELDDLLRAVGFTVLATTRAFGDPPQAIVAVARKAAVDACA